MAPSKTTLTNWDPALLVSQASFHFRAEKALLTVLQIVSMQTLHYLTLSIITPPLLSIFAEAKSLAYEGGPANIGDYFALHCCGKLNLMADRYDHGLAGNGWASDSKRDANRREVVGMEWWKKNRLRLER